jgi:signal recognition particle subunit SRP54
MFDHLSSRFSSIVKTMRGHTRLSEENIQEALREVRMALLEADVALPVVKNFIADVKTKAQGQEVIGSLTPGQAFIGVVNDELTRLMGGSNDALNLAAQPPAVILMAGLQGAGKTTTVGKLAKKLKEEQKKKVLVVSADVYRPAAIEQLKTLAAQIDIGFFASTPDQKPSDIAAAALDHAKRYHFDVLIVDTAGRLAIDEVLMTEIQDLQKLLNPIEILFVVDAMQGQDAANTAKAFNEALPLTGVILTKMDGDSRGGAALSVRAITGKPIKFIGVSEKLTGLEAFHPDRLASRILGMGDVLSLIEQVQNNVDQAETDRMAKKLRSGKSFDLEDFLTQMQQMKKMGGLSSMMEKMPGKIGAMAGQMEGEAAEKGMKRIEGIIHSMTVKERRKPELLKASRKKRIAAGAGVSVQEVNKLLKQFEEMQKMMKIFSSKGGMMKMMKGIGGIKDLFGGGK